MWEEYGFKDMDLWETFQDNFKDFMEEDFKSASFTIYKNFELICQNTVYRYENNKDTPLPDY